MQLIGAREQRLIDRAWQEKTGLPLLLLMEAAAAAVVRLCRDLAGQQGAAAGWPVLVLCGRGQNGGDAYACARLLAAAGWPVQCRELFPDADLPEEAHLNRQALIRLGIPLAIPRSADFTTQRPALIIDGIFGSGFAAGRGVPDLFGDVSRWIATARNKGSQVVAIDLPSGVDGNTGRVDPAAIRADWTVTFVRPKIGLLAAPGCFFAGRICLDSIGIEEALVDQVLQDLQAPGINRIDQTTVKPWCPPRPPDGHKGLFGRLLLIGGCEAMPGAVVLSADAAARSGIGLLQLAVPPSIRDGVLRACPEALQLPVGTKAAEPPDWQPAVTSASAVAIGPGLARPDWLPALLELLINTADNLVVDADALNAISRDLDHFWSLTRQRSREGGKPPAILTPHPGEFRRLAPDLDLQDRRQAAMALSKRSGCIVVLKGAATVVAEPDGSCWFNTTGQDGLARGGSGDVLTGLLGGLLAQGLSPAQAACAAVYFHGLAADLAAAVRGRRAMLPRDLLEHLGSAFHQSGWEVTHV